MSDLTTSDNLNNWADSGRILHRSSISRYLESGLIYEYGEISLADDFNIFPGYAKIISENLNSWADEIIRQLNTNFAAFTDNLNNWQDSLVISNIYNLILSDDNNTNWADFIRFDQDYSLVIEEDALRLVDDFVYFKAGSIAGIQVTAGDNANFFTDGDDLVLGHGLSLFDDLNLWFDLFENSLSASALIVDEADDLANWLDAFTTSHLGIIDIVAAESLTLTDAINLIYSYGEALSDDSNNWNDQFQTLGNLILADNLNNWLDSINFLNGQLLSVSEDINFELDAITFTYGYEIDLSASLDNWFDDYSQVNVGIIVGLDLVLFEDATGLLLDAIIISPFGYEEIITTDDLNSWLDDILFGYGLNIIDDGSTNWVDQLYLGSELDLIDDLNTWDDSLIPVLEYLISLSDDLNNWLDALVTSVTISELTLDVQDYLNTWLDAISFERVTQLVINESINFWLDAISFNVLNFFDSLNFWNDRIQFSYDYGLNLEDDLNRWGEDIFVFDFGTSSDAAVFVSSYYRRYLNDVGSMDLAYDFLGIIPLQIYEDTLVGVLADFVDLFTTEIIVNLLISVDFNDVLDPLLDAFVAEMTETFTSLEDDLNNWLDAWNTDLAAHIHQLVEDDLNNWLDAISFVYDPGLALSDDINTLTDVSPEQILGILLALSDSGSSYWNEYEFSYEFNEDINSWTDLFATDFNVTFLGVSMSDDINQMLDSFQSAFVYLLNLSDDNSGNWNASETPSPGTQTFRLTSTSTGTFPFMVGLGFAKAELTTGPALTGISNYQSVVKRLWNDGSIKHAIISGRASLTANIPLTISVGNGTAPSGSNLTSANITSAAPTASVQCGVLGTVTLTSLLASPVRTWISGPEMVECHYRSAVGSEASLAVGFQVRLFADGRIWIRAFVENGYLDIARANKSYVPTIIIGGVTVYNNGGASLTHYATTRYMAEGWIGGNPNVTPSHNTIDLIDSKLVPYYWKRNPSASALNALTQVYTPMGNGDHTPQMHDAGFQNALGVITNWEALYCTSVDSRAYKATVVNSYHLSSYPIIWRDSVTKLFPKPSDYPSWNEISSYNVFAGPLEFEFNHHPSCGYLAYLITGDYWHYETILASMATLYLQLSYGPGPVMPAGRGTGVNKILTGEDRGTSWTLRTLSQLCAIAPDGDAVVADYRTLLINNINHWVSVINNSLGFLWIYNLNAYGTPGVVAPWQEHFGAASLGLGSDIEPLTDMTNYNTVRDFVYKVSVGMAGPGAEYCFNDASAYNIRISNVANETDQTTWYSTWAQVHTASVALGLISASACSNTLRGVSAGDPALAPTGYWGNYLPGLAYAVDHAASGASASWARITGATNYNTLANSGFDNTPVFGIVPRGTSLSGVPAWVSALPLWQWYEIPNTALSSVAPSPPSLGTASSKITAWCGASLRRNGSVYILGAAGGHGDYGGNEVDALALNVTTPAWVQLKSPTPAAYIIDKPAQFYLQEPDGKYRPSPTHTYYATQYIDSLDRMVVIASPGIFGVSGAQPMPPGFPYQGETRSFVFNYQTNDWEHPDYFAIYSFGGDFTAGMTCKHPTTNDIYLARNGTGAGFNRWNAATNTWTHLTGNGGFGEQNYCASAIDPIRNRMLVVGDFAGNLAPRMRDLTGNEISVSFSGLGPNGLKFGGSSPNEGNYPGLVYDEANDTFLAVYNKGSVIEVRRVNASTLLVDDPTITGTKPATRQNGTLGAIQYVPELGGIVIANSYTGNVKFMRTAII